MARGLSGRGKATAGSMRPLNVFAPAISLAAIFTLIVAVIPRSAAVLTSRHCSQYFGFFEGGKSIACILFLAFRLSYFQPTLKNLHTTTSKRSELILWMQSVSFVSSEIRMSTCLRLQQEDESTPCVVAALSSTISSKGDDLNDVLTTEVKSLSCFMYSTFYFRSLLTYCRRFFFFATDFCWSVLRPLAVTETMACAAATASSTECTFLSR